MNLIKNKKVKNAAKTVLCILLCVMFSFQAFALPAGDSKSFTPTYDEKYKKCYSIANLDAETVKSIGKINPIMDELLDAYVEMSLYDLTREQALAAMLKKCLMDYPELIPYLGDSLLKAFDEFGGYYPLDDDGYGIFSTVYFGYGLVLGGKKLLDGNKYYTVIDQIMLDSPAAKAGLKRGDEIIKVENIDVEGLGMNAVSALLRTYKSLVSLTVRRGSKDIKVSMDKDTVYIPAVSFKLDEENKTALLSVDNFLDIYMVYDLYYTLLYFEEHGYKNLIIDLRENTGGNVWNMLEFLNMLIPEEGVSLYSQIYKDGEIESVESTGEGMKFDKICVLTNGNTASASEVFSLSLRELTGAVLIGEKTFGKGVGQFAGPLSNGDEIAITGFEILSAKGNKYHKKGIEPDIKIAPVYTNVKNTAFAQLNFVNCLSIKKGADNKAVLALNQRLARIGYLSPDDMTSKCTDKTITAVEIFQKYNGLPVGISKIDYRFIDHLNYFVSYAAGHYEKDDVQLECAKLYIKENMKTAKDYAAKSAKKPAA